MLNALYQAQPSARKAVESAAGYDAFSNLDMKLLLAGGGKGEGIDVNKPKGMTYRRHRKSVPGCDSGWTARLASSADRQRSCG
ncbi:hypothetical protein BN2475_420090 [Paraburkholderia ribeironis]|uniref:Uncharacterized protein n=1 Tax=Paraburkholderia ribeironis TaxID=1247936 RepID=A0A1N7S7M8_9BURK|nr:hypothetical protein [Paraburkholderia ribeironis]SIT43396.1 hypothetical protein BN2475_420090 [Paraburkholderia ribeironis]